MAEITNLGAVIYTDGGCNPNNGQGFMGSGVHGYTYDQDAAMLKPGKAKLATTTQGYLDREMLNARQKTDSTVVEVKPVQFIEIVVSDTELGTNNIAEMQALAVSLERLSEIPNMRSIVAFLDSQYTIDGVLTHCENWQRNNWLKRDGEPPKNLDLWKRLYALYVQTLQRGITVQLLKIKGHAGLYGNMMADFLAGIGVRRSELAVKLEDYKLLEPKEFSEADIDRNPLFAYRRMYFNSRLENHQAGRYYMSAPGKLKIEAMEGRRVADSVFGVVFTPEPDPILETVVERHAEIYRDRPTQVVRIDLDRLYNKAVIPMVERFGGLSLIQPRATKSESLVFAFDSDPVTCPQDPIGMTMQAINAMVFLESLLNWFNLTSTAELLDLAVLAPQTQDITDLFYESVETKKGPSLSLRKEITSNLTHLDVTVRRDDIDKLPVAKVMLGLDILPRNNLKRLETQNARVLLITWKDSANVVRYGTIVQSDLGTGIWANYFTNKLYVH